MTQFPDHFQPLDPGRIDTQSNEELHYWTREFQCTEPQLLEAIGRVGNHVSAVREHLEAHHSVTGHKGRSRSS
jgi:hypothetical protein